MQRKKIIGLYIMVLVIGGRDSVTPLFQGREYIPGYKRYKTCQLGDYMLPTTQTTFEPEENHL